MKHPLFALFTFLPLLLSAQSPESISIANEVEKLLDTCQGYIFLKKFDQALPCIETAKLKAEADLGIMSAGYAKCVHYQADVYIKMGKFSEALPYCILAKDIREKVLDKKHLDYSLSLSYLATLYKELDQYDKAELLALQAKEIRAINPGKTSREYGIILHLLGNVYHKLGQYEKSEDNYLETKDLFAKKSGKASQDYSLVGSNLAALYYDWGKYGQVEALYLEAKVNQAKFPGKESAAYAGTLNNLASFYFKTGQYNKAEPLFIEAGQIFAKVYGEKHEHYVSSLTNLASFYYEIGQYGRAELLFLQAKDVLEKTSGKENRTYASTLSNFGAFYFDVGQYDKAEANFLEACQILEKVPGKDHPDYATALTNLGNLYYKTEKYADAERLWEEAKNIREKTFGNDHPDYATSLNNLAQLYSDRGQYAKAEPLFLKAKDIWAKTLGVSHPSFATLLQGLAQLYARTGDFGKAEPLFLEANGIIRYSIQNAASYFSEKEMLGYLQTYEEDLVQFHSFSKTYPNPAFNRASFDNALFYKGFLLENARDLARAVAGADSLTRDTYERWQGCRRRLAREHSKPIVERRFVTEMEAEAEGYEKTLTPSLPTFDTEFYAPTWRDVRDHLEEGEAAVEFVSFHYFNQKSESHDSTFYAAIVLLSGENTPNFIPLFEELQLQTLFNRPEFGKELILKHLYGNSPGLRQLVWQPLEPLLRNIKTIYYAPAGLLHRVNLAAIQDETEQLISEGRQWVRVGSTRALVSGRLADKSFAKISDADSTIDNPQSAIIYGGIIYEMDSLAYTAVNPARQMESTSVYTPKDGNFCYIITERWNTKVHGRSNPDGCWGTLASTMHETDEVNALLLGTGFRTEVQKEFYASEEQFKEIGVHEPSPRILHIATHGFAYPDPKKDRSKVFGDPYPAYKLLDDPMLRSGLVLAGANFYCKNKRPLTNAEDGMLVAYEVRDLNLQNTELAVLSACQTGLGDVVGSEGVYGLQRAFRIAGVKFQIVSLWEVPDDQTRELMRFFYQNWLEKKESLRDAFNHAQQTLKEKEPSPYMWAGFVLIE